MDFRPNGAAVVFKYKSMTMNKKTMSKKTKKNNTMALAPALNSGEHPVDKLIPNTNGTNEIEEPRKRPTLDALLINIENRELDGDELYAFEQAIIDKCIMTGPGEGVMYCRFVHERAYFITWDQHKHPLHFAGDARMYVVWWAGGDMPDWHLAMWLPLQAPDTLMLDAFFEKIRDEVFIPAIEFLADKHAKDTAHRADEWQRD